MNMLIFSIFLLNKGDFATSTLAPPFCCSKMATCCCRPVIRVRSCFSQVEKVDCGAEVVGCFVGYCCCCCYYQDMYGSGSNSNSNGNDDFSYKDKQSSLSELMTSY